jgi:hypothetical protein
VVADTAGEADALAATFADPELLGRKTTNAVMIRPITTTAARTVPPFLTNSRRRRDAARAAAAFLPRARRSRLLA